MGPVLIFYLLIGLAAGVLGGLLGVGGGLVTVPSLMLIFWCLDFPPEFLVHLAIGTSLGAMVFTAAASAYAHSLKNGVDGPFFRGLAPGIILGAIGSAWIAKQLSSQVLEKIFGVCLCVIGLYFCISKATVKEGHLGRPYFLLLAALGIGIGGISTILGIGGGIITVPLLTAFRLPMRNAIATSAATGFLIAVSGAASFLMVGIQEKIVPGSVGYLYLPAFIPIGIAAMVTAPLGARLTYILPTEILRRIFGVFLWLTGVTMLF